MEELPIIIRHLKRSRAKQVDLSKRDMVALPKELLELPLESLNLSQNRITELNESIGQIWTLKHLDLSQNQLRTLPAALSKMPDLISLNLAGNPLVPPFDLLLAKDSQTAPALKGALASCFGGDTSSVCSEGSMVDKYLEADSQSALWKSKAEALEKQIKDFGSQLTRRESGLALDSDTVLELKFQSLTVGKEIGKGGFSIIYQGEYFGSPVCVKRLFDPNITQELLDEFSNEINMLARFRHPSIILLLGIVSRRESLFIVTELVKNGSLFELLHKRKAAMDQAFRGRLMLQLAQVLAYLHSHRVAHRDIKSHNVMVTGSGQAKLIDFGLCRKEEELNRGPMQFSGTPTYMAPEMFQKKATSLAVDIFAFGTLLWQVFAGEVPYDGLDPADIKDRVLKDSQLPPRSSVPAAMLALANECRQQSPEKRPSALDLVGRLS